MEAVVSARREMLANIVVTALAVTYAGAVILAVPRSSAPLTTYGGRSPVFEAIDLTAGIGLLVAGLAAWREGWLRRIGVLALLVGVVWFAPDWEGWNYGPGLARSLGAGAALLLVPLVLHLALAYPSGRVRSHPLSYLVGAAYVVACALGVALALVRDPLLDPVCWRNCLANVFLVHAEPGVAHRLTTAWTGVALALGLVLGSTCAWRLATAGRTARRTLWPVLVPGIAFGASTVAFAAALLRTPLEDPRDGLFASLYVVRAISLLALAVGLLVAVLRARRTRAAVERLVSDLGDSPAPGRPRETLAHAVADPTLEVVYPIGDGTRWVDSDGAPVSPPGSGQGRHLTEIFAARRLIALIAHDAAVDGARLRHDLGSGALLALENERLRAELLAQLGELRASRARIVDRADAERRRLERDLHDGAQQRLLALSYDLRLSRAHAMSAGAPDVVSLLDQATEITGAALDDLRELAHGIHPAVLTEAGLAAALETLADRSQVSVEIRVDEPAGRLPPAVESAAYVAVAEAIGDAVGRHARFVTVGVTRRDGRLELELHDDGQPRHSPLAHVADRVGAVGGELEVDAVGMRLEIPCA